MTVSVEIPTDVTVRLVVNTVAFAIADPLFQAVAGTCFAFSCIWINRGSITREGEIDKSFFSGDIQELGPEDFNQASSRGKIHQRLNAELFQKVINRFFLPLRSSLLSSLAFSAFPLAGGAGRNYSFYPIAISVP